MSNPVLERVTRSIEKERRTPAGYPTMPGYQVGGHSSLPGGYGSSAPSQNSPQGQIPPAYSQQPGYGHMPPSYAEQGNAVHVEQKGLMTYDDVIIKTASLFGILVLCGALSWAAASVSIGLAVGLMFIGLLGGFVSSMVVIFSRTIKVPLIWFYAACEGASLGALSFLTEKIYPGVVIEAVIATVVVFAVMLTLFASGKIRNSSKLARFTFISLIGLLVLSGINFIFSMTGVAHFSTMKVGGMSLGLLIGIVAVVIAALCLVQDFDQIKQGIQMGASSRYSWMCAFGLMVTIVWMYVQILRVLSELRD